MCRPTWSIHPIVDKFKNTLTRRLYQHGYFPGFIKEDEGISSNCTSGWVQALSAHLQDYDSHVLWYDGSEAAKIEIVRYTQDQTIFLISLRSVEYSLARECINIIRGRHSQAKILLGGVHPTIEPHHTYEDLKPDYLVPGEADHFIRNLVEYITGEAASLSGVPCESLLFAENPRGKVIPAVASPAAIKIDWQLHYKYTNAPYKYTPSLMCTRDCLFDCHFCSIVRNGVSFRKLRFIPVKQVTAYIRNLQEITDHAHPLHILVDDPTLLADKYYARELIRAIAGMDITWEFQTRIEKPTKEIQDLFEEMVAGGCLNVYFGCETSDQAVQKAINKNVNVEYIWPMMKMAKDAGLVVTNGWIMGLPFQSRESVRKDLEFICRSIQEGIVAGSDYFFLNIYPGSRFYTNPRRFGLRLHSNECPTGIDYQILHDTSQLKHDEIWNLYLEGCSQLTGVMEEEF